MPKKSMMMLTEEPFKDKCPRCHKKAVVDVPLALRELFFDFQTNTPWWWQPCEFRCMNCGHKATPKEALASARKIGYDDLYSTGTVDAKRARSATGSHDSEP